MDSARFPILLGNVYAAVDELERMFPGRHFTPDGHMVGSIGEAVAAYYYGITLFTASAKGHDGKADGRLVQVKATQAKMITISSEPEFLLVLKIGSTTNEVRGIETGDYPMSSNLARWRA